MFERALGRPERGAGDLAVAGGGFELVVTHEHLDHSNVDLLLEKVGGEAVPERMQGHGLVDAGRLPGVMEGPAELAGGQRIDRVLAQEQPAPG